MLGVWQVLLMLCAGVAVLGTATEGESGGSVVVDTPLGSVKGEVREAGPDRYFYAFTGIPYAKPPVAALRFKDPEPAEAWTGVRENFQPPTCPQNDLESMLKGEAKIMGDEDCLYLHVYTPQVNASGLPVMVFIHGGGYALGAAGSAGGSPLPLLTRDVVLVAIQYRLGTLGFLSTEDDVLPGNLGLKDQTEALRWVQANIKSFGGDPGKVTIFGESAGAGSVHLQILSPTAEGLFHRAIMQSGNALCPWSLRNDHLVKAGRVGQMLECPGVTDAQVVDSAALFSCLQEAPLDKLVLASSSWENWYHSPFYMVPRVDGQFLPAHPATLLREGRFNKVDIISGICAHEGASTLHGVVRTPEGQRLEGNFSHLAPFATSIDEEDDATYLAHRIFSYYHGSGYLNVTSLNLSKMVQMFSELMFSVPHDVVSQHHARDQMYGRKVFMYQLDHVGKHSLLDMLNMSLSDNLVGHGDDLQYMFTDVFGAQPIEREDDLMLSRIFLDLWTNFAADGNPTPDMSLGFKWFPATPSNLNHLSLTPAPVMKPNTRDENRAFLLDLPIKANKKLLPNKFTAKGNPASGSCPA